MNTFKQQQKMGWTFLILTNVLDPDPNLFPDPDQNDYFGKDLKKLVRRFSLTS